MRVTSKGQVTIPIDLRERFGIDEHVEVDFEPTEKGILLLVRKMDRGQQVVERMRAAGKLARKELSTDELMRLMRGWGEPDPGFDD